MENFIKQCQTAYYAGESLISNEEYDALIKRFPECEVAIGGTGEIPHAFRMWSLDKKYPCRGDVLPDTTKYVESNKLDGCAVDLLYIDGKLIQCLTRGDGIKGTDRTANIAQLVPKHIEEYGIFQVTGEVCVSKVVANMRNYASGAVNLDDPKEFTQRIGDGGLKFVAYGVQLETEHSGIYDTYREDMAQLAHDGFNTILSADIQALCESEQIPTDGIVYRLNNNDSFDEAGFTHKFPKGAFAVKEDEECTWTTLREVVWQVGKTGKVTPVAIFDEIELEGAKTTRATLNNVLFMQGLGVTHIGQEIGLIRAGGVIPKIVEVK